MTGLNFKVAFKMHCIITCHACVLQLWSRHHDFQPRTREECSTGKQGFTVSDKLFEITEKILIYYEFRKFFIYLEKTE